MIIHYFKTAKRALIKNRYYTFINIFGLVCGTVSALIIAKYIGGSFQFDHFHVKKDRIYAIIQEESLNNNPQKSSGACYWGVGELLKQYPEVVNLTRFSYHAESLVISDEGNGNSVSFTENSIFATDSSFLNTFSFPLIHGNPNTALYQPNSIVLTNTASRKYFGNTNPIGKTLTIRTPWGQETAYNITGVLKDLPSRSRFNFDFLISGLPWNTADFWKVPEYSTYVLLKENATIAGLDEKLANSLNKIPELKSANKKVNAIFEPLTSVRLSETAYVLAAVGIFILLISWVNYINQVVAQSYARMKEIDILRVMGAGRSDLMVQFAVESGLVCFLSLALTVVIYLSVEPFLQSFTNGHLLPLVEDPTPINFIFLAIFLIGIILTAGIPIAIFYSQNSGAVLRKVRWNKAGSIGLRKALVVVQFSISAVLMISVFVIGNQLEFMKNKDKGINMENVLVVKSPMIKDTTWIAKRKTLERFKEKCAELPFVMETTSSTTVASEEYRQETYLGFQEKNEQFLVHQNGIDEHFLDLYDVELIAGHNFIPDAGFKNRSSIILNESAARGLGIKDFDKAISSQIVDYESNEVYELIGIVKDYHQTSLKYEMKPMAFKFNVFRGHISLRMNTSGLNGSQFDNQINSIKQIWEEVYRDASFDFFFLDEKFEAQDREDRYFGNLFKFFTVLSIVISCIGLFGLSLFISIKRQKEIGVRKVFGASSVDILSIFCKGYAGPLLASAIIGSPLACLLMNIWLRNYAYRVEIGFETVTMALISLTLIFFITVSYHILKSSAANPVTILKAE